MNFISSFKLSIKNIKNNKILFLPYILSSTLMMSILYIMSSLVSNEYIRNRNKQLPIIMEFGVVISFIFVIAFIIYINNFINKKRSMELSLYNVLGLEKKHILKIIFIEQTIIYMIISIFGILGGYLLGQLCFMILSSLINGVGSNVTNYPFSYSSMLVVLISVGIVFCINIIVNAKNITFSSTSDLMKKSKKNEEELKYKKTFSILGVICIFVGYYIAITSKGFMSSMSMFFVAVIFVIIGMYLFFIFSVTEILKKLRNNKKIYYDRKNFFWISGMIKRMKGNGASLATITILCTCIIVTLATTITITLGIENALYLSNPREYSLDYNYNELSNNKKLEEIESNIEKIINKSNIPGVKVKNKCTEISRIIASKFKDGKIIPMETKGIDPFFVKVETENSYNQLNGKKVKLNPDEVLISYKVGDNIGVDKNTNSIDLYGRKFRIKGYIDSESDDLKVVVKNVDVLMQTIMRGEDIKNRNEVVFSVNTYWDVSGLNGRKKEYVNLVNKNIKKYGFTEGMNLMTRSDLKKIVYALNGGFIFMGGIVSIIFLLGIILVTYYKQVFEGYADRDNIQIMKKVGLDKDLIKRNLSSQLWWFFLIPIIIAPINALVASKILYTILYIFGIKMYFIYFKVIAIVFLLVCISYYILYRITSRVYYKIVK